MKKNKLITLILALAVCSSLILSLCSFTTIKDETQYDIMTPYCDYNINYVYHRQTATLNEKYYGVIPHFNQLLADAHRERWSTNKASDYHIVGNTTLNYTGVTQNNTLNKYIGLVSEDVSVAYFDGNFSLSNFGLDNDNGIFGADSIDFILNKADVIDGVNYLDYVVSVEYAYLGGDGSDLRKRIYSYSIDLSYSSGTLDDLPIGTFYDYETGSTGFNISIVRLLDNVYKNLSANDSTTYAPIYIYNLSLIPDNDIIATSVYTDCLYNEYSARNQILFEKYKSLLGRLFDIKYNNGYENGFTDGLVKGENSWSGFTDFLEKTVSSFLDFEFIPNVSFGGILSVILGLLLVFSFLRLFAGG